MVRQNSVLLLDADVLIAAYRVYYAPDYCPGFWSCLEHYLGVGRLLIIDPVRDEIDAPNGLVQWVNQLPQHAFASIDASIMQTYQTVAEWIRQNPQFTAAALNEFANGADGWLIAYAMVHNATIITNEVSARGSRNRVKLPELCDQFRANDPLNTQGMLRELGAHFEWRAP